MPVNAALSEFNDAGTRSNNGDPYLLSVKEASIVRQRLFVDAPYEADMLKHKARVLYDLASQHDLTHKIPRLDFMEEARVAQYRSECIAAACFQRGLDPNHLMRTASSSAPVSFRPWLSRSMGQQDPIFASAKIISKKDDDHFRTYRCPDFNCRHYVYGFTSQQELDKHHLLHKSLDAEEHFRLTHGSSDMNGTNFSPTATAMYPEEPPKMSPLNIANLISPSYEGGEGGPPSIAPSSTAVASEQDAMSPTLSAFSTYGDMVPPPYESERPGPSAAPPRLESIGELGESGEHRHCLGCPTADNENDPCTCDIVEQQEDGQWRQTRPSATDNGIRQPRQSQIVQRYRRDLDQYLRKSMGFPDAIRNMVRENADFHDGFWRIFELVVPAAESEVLAETAWSVFSPPSATLCSLAMWWNGRPEPYSVSALLAASGTLSKTRAAEESSYPVLSQAKVLLREALLLGLTGNQPFLHLGSMSYYPPVPDETLLFHQTAVVQDNLKKFIEMFEAMCGSRVFSPRRWLAAFLALCIFSVAGCILSDAPEETLTRLIGGEGAVTTPAEFYESFQRTFKILADLFSNVGSNLLDSPSTTVPTEDTIPFEHAYKAIHRDNWGTLGFETSTQFLYSLAELEPTGQARARADRTPTEPASPDTSSSYHRSPESQPPQPSHGSQNSHAIGSPTNAEMSAGWVPVPMNRLASSVSGHQSMDIDMTREHQQRTNGQRPPPVPGYGSPVPGYSGPIDSPSPSSEREGQNGLEWSEYGSQPGSTRHGKQPEHGSQQNYAMQNGYHGEQVNGHSPEYSRSHFSSGYSSSHTVSERSVPMSPSDASTPRAPSDTNSQDTPIAFSDYGSRRGSAFGYGSRRPSEYTDTNGSRTPRATSPRPSTASTMKNSVSFVLDQPTAPPSSSFMTSPSPGNPPKPTFDFGGPRPDSSAPFNFSAAKSAAEHLAQIQEEAAERAAETENGPGASSQQQDGHAGPQAQSEGGADRREDNFFAFRATAPESVAENPAAEDTAATPGKKGNNKRRRRTGGAGVNIKASYQRPPIRRVFCGKCGDYPEGFRGEHELRRHTQARHSTLVKRWIIREPPGPRQPDTLRPTVPLSNCKACLMLKNYGAYYNAAAHLRRAHFCAPKGAPKPASDWPNMNQLREWMEEVEKPPDELYGNANGAGGSGHRGGGDASDDEEGPGGGRRHRNQNGDIDLRDAPSQIGSTASIGQETPGGSVCPHPGCGKVLRDLNAHMLTHQAERPEKCPVQTCNYHSKGFARKYDRNRHALTHYRGNLLCPFCPLTAKVNSECMFTRPDVFKRHLASVHYVERESGGAKGKGKGKEGEEVVREADEDETMRDRDEMALDDDEERAGAGASTGDNANGGIKSEDAAAEKRKKSERSKKNKRSKRFKEEPGEESSMLAAGRHGRPEYDSDSDSDSDDSDDDDDADEEPELIDYRTLVPDGPPQHPVTDTTPLTDKGVPVQNDGRCTICDIQFTVPQEFYEHLDECVMTSLIPAHLRFSNDEPGEYDEEEDEEEEGSVHEHMPPTLEAYVPEMGGHPPPPAEAHAMNDEPRQSISEFSPAMINSSPPEGNEDKRYTNTTGYAPMAAGHERSSAPDQGYAASVDHAPERAEFAESGHKPKANERPPENRPADQTLSLELQETSLRRESIQQHHGDRLPDPPDKDEPDQLARERLPSQPPEHSSRSPERLPAQTSQQTERSEQVPPHPPEPNRPSDQGPVPPPDRRPQTSNDPPDRRRHGNTGYDPRPKQPIVNHAINDMQMDHERPADAEMELDE